MQLYENNVNKILVMTKDDPPKCPVLKVSKKFQAVLRDDFKGKVFTSKTLLNKFCSL
jgi:hypothetical protein